MKTTILAIDPGKQGGLAIRWTDGKIEHASFKKREFGDILDTLKMVQRCVSAEEWPCVCYYEKPPWTLGKAVPESSAMVFGWNCGMLMGALRAMDFPVIEVSPHSYLRYDKKKIKTTGEKKRHNRELARTFFPAPREPITIEVADAFLLLNYALTKESGIER